MLLFIPMLGRAECPPWIKDDVKSFPECPTTGSLLPETYPIGALVVSDKGVVDTMPDFTLTIVEKTLRGAGKNTPLIFLPVEKSTFAKVQAHIKKMDIDQPTKEKWLRSLRHIPSEPYTYQQDYMQAFFNPKTGLPILRKVQGSAYQTDSFEQIYKVTKECGFAAGREIPNEEKSSANRGGNIETLPGGICILGDGHARPVTKWVDDWKDLADEVCAPGEENRIKVPTNWLKIGHADEVIKVIRNNKAQAPCNFSVAIASPPKAMELLKAKPREKFLTADNSEGGKPRWSRFGDLSLICKKQAMYEELMLQGVPAGADSQSVGSNTKNSMQRAPADATPAKNIDCTKITNADVYRIFSRDPNLQRFNDLVEDEMKNLRKEVTEKLGKKFPQCKVDILDVPNLFTGTPERVGDNFKIAHRYATSVLPNPANSISVNDTIISPEPGNSVFKEYLEKQYTDRGLNAEFVDTFEYGHRGDGNVHCVTNTIHLCRPRTQPVGSPGTELEFAL